MGTPPRVTPRPHGHPTEAPWAPHRGSHRGPMGTPPRTHGGPAPLLNGIDEFHPKGGKSVPPRSPHRDPTKSLPQSMKTEDGLGGEPAHSTPLPTPSLSSMSDSFLKSKFDMGDRSSVPGVRGKVWSWQVLLEGPMGTPRRSHGHHMEAAWAPHGGRMGIPQRPHGHPTETAWAHGHPSETAQGGPSPILHGIAKSHPKCVNSVRSLTPPRHPPEFDRWSWKTEHGLGGEPAPSTPSPPPRCPPCQTLS